MGFSGNQPSCAYHHVIVFVVQIYRKWRWKLSSQGLLKESLALESSVFSASDAKNTGDSNSASAIKDIQSLLRVHQTSERENTRLHIGSPAKGRLFGMLRKSTLSATKKKVNIKN